MKRLGIAPKILCLALACIVPLCQASTRLEEDIQSVLSRFKRRAEVGIRIQDMSTGDILFERNSRQLLKPASNFKLFTAVALLLQFEPNFRFQTNLFTDVKQVTRGSLNGNLFIKFSGDPSLGFADLESLLEKLKELSIQHINGNIYLDDSGYQKVIVGNGWRAKDRNYCYSAPVSGMNLDHNCLVFTLRPNKIGKVARIEPYQVAGLSNLRNFVITKPDPHRRCSVRLNTSDPLNYTLQGCIGTHSRGRGVSVSIKDPNQYVRRMIEVILQHHGITLSGSVNIRSGINFSTLQLLNTHDSKPLWQLNSAMLKDSDNLYAESFIKKLGENYFHAAGGWETGVKALVNILRDRAGVDLSSARIADGSGLSHYNYVTAEQLSKLLYFAYHNFLIEPELMAALPVSGKDGTLKHRMGTAQMRGRVRAKTGTLEGASSLSGYIVTKRNRVVSFVILINGMANSRFAYRSLQDNICRLLVEQS